MKPRADADDDDPAERVQRLEVAGHVRRADELEDDVERAVLLEALGVEDLLGAERGDAVAAVGVAHGGDDLRPRRGAELDRGRADAAGGAVDEQALARPQGRLGEQRVVGGGEDLGDRAGRVQLEALGHGHELALVDDRELGLAAPADDAHDAVALLEAARAGAERGDLAGELQAGDVRRRAGRRGVAALALQDVGAVEPGAAHAHEDLARAGLGVGVLGDLQRPAFADGDGPHGAAS